MKGAVQGVATITASTPVKNAPSCRRAPARPWPTPASRPPNSKTPDRFEPDDEEQVGDQEREHRRLELEAPAHVADAGTDGDRRPRAMIAKEASTPAV